MDLQEILSRKTKFLLKRWHPLKRHTPLRVEQFFIYVDLMKLSLIIWHLKKFKVWSFHHSFSPPSLSPPPLIFSHLQTNPQHSPIHSSSISSPLPTLAISPFSPLILLPLLSFNHSSSFFSIFFSNQGVIKKEILNLFLTKSHQSRIFIKILSFLSFWVIDHPSLKYFGEIWCDRSSL